MLADPFGHFWIKRRQKLIEHLDHGYLLAAPRQVLGHFEADETAACDQSGLRLFLFDPITNVSAVRDTPQSEDSRQINARQRRPKWLCTGSQEERVVVLPIKFAGYQVAHFDFLCLTKYSD